MKTRSAKQKGRRLAQRVRDMLLEIYPTSPDDIRVNPSSVCGEDILLSPRARDIFPFAIECKCQEKLNVWKAIKQAESHAEGTKHTPLVVFSRNRSKDYVICEAEFFFQSFIRGNGT